MKIWRSFQLHGTTYKVLVVPEHEWEHDDEEENLGIVSFKEPEVHLKKGNSQVMQHTLCHELVHAILTHMGESELTRNEKFVDSFAGLLHQALLTAE